MFGAVVIGIFIAALGAFGLAAPQTFFTVVGFFQEVPVLYGSAVIRLAIGIVLIGAARAGRPPRAARALRVLGTLIAVGGAVTPLVGARFARMILETWASGGPAVIRVWAGAGVALGASILYATRALRRTAATAEAR